MSQSRRVRKHFPSFVNQLAKIGLNVPTSGPWGWSRWPPVREEASQGLHLAAEAASAWFQAAVTQHIHQKETLFDPDSSFFFVFFGLREVIADNCWKHLLSEASLSSGEQLPTVNIRLFMQRGENDGENKAFLHFLSLIHWSAQHFLGFFFHGD